MTDQREISEDRGFKALFESYPRETIEVFASDLLAERGQPTTVAMLPQESALPDLGDPSRFLDVAMLATWSDGSQAVILLIEHWSKARKVDLRRVNWYVADLALRHPRAVVFPVLLVTDRRAHAIPEQWTMTVAGITMVALRVRISQVTAADLPRLRSLQNRVAAILTALVAQDAVDAVVAVLQQMARSPGPLDDLERFLPFAIKLARMPESDAPRFRSRLEETGMINVITEMKKEREAKVRAAAKAEGEAEGEAKGKARGQVEEICRLVARDLLSPAAARTEILDLIATGAIPPEIGHEGLVRLE